MFTNADEVIAIIEQRKNRGYGLQYFKDYMQTLGNPQYQLRCIHIAGTNGKGSTTNDLRSILQTAGYRVGSFTSPYIINHYDRIRINDVYIEKEEFLDIVNHHYHEWIQWDLSMFEIDMCIAVLYFLKRHTDICIFEVGLGGRLDSTNILHPLICVITNIGLDHMALLGNTKAEIAYEKAGILKQNIDLITQEHALECLDVFQKQAKKLNSQIVITADILNMFDQENGMVFDYKQYLNTHLSSHARYQCKNAALAIEIIDYLNVHTNFHVSEKELREGLYKANWIGRFEIMKKQPLLLLDGAHNADGIEALVDSLKGIDNLRIIFSVLKDKNFVEMLLILQSITKDIVVTPFHNERALDMQTVSDASICYEDTFETAIQKAMSESKNIVITGSLYFISEVRQYLILNHIV